MRSPYPLYTTPEKSVSDSSSAILARGIPFFSARVNDSAIASMAAAILKLKASLAILLDQGRSPKRSIICYGSGSRALSRSFHELRTSNPLGPVLSV